MLLFNGPMTNAAVDWRERARTGPVHFLGLGGAGVSGAARVLVGVLEVARRAAFHQAAYEVVARAV